MPGVGAVARMTSSPAAAAAAASRVHGELSALRGERAFHASAGHTEGDHSLRFSEDADDDNGDDLPALYAPLPLPSQLPSLFQSLEELIISGLPPTCAGAQTCWVSQLLQQLQVGVHGPAKADAPGTRTSLPTMDEVDGDTRRAAAPRLRRLLFLDAPYTSTAARRSSASPRSGVDSAARTATTTTAPMRALLSPDEHLHVSRVSSPPRSPLFQIGRNEIVTLEVGDLGRRSGAAPAFHEPATVRLHLLASSAARRQEQTSRRAQPPSPSPSSLRVTGSAEATSAASTSSYRMDETTPSMPPPPPPPLLPSPLEELYVAPSVPWVLAPPLKVSPAASPSPASPMPLPHALPWICHCPNLLSLNLSHSAVTDDVCGQVVAALPLLSELHLSWCMDLQEVPAVLRRATSRRLHVLNLVGLSSLTSEALESLCLRACPWLMQAVEELYLAQTPVVAVGCVAFACPQLRRLQLPDATVLDATSAASPESAVDEVQDLDGAARQRVNYEERLLARGSSSNGSKFTPASPRGSALSVQGYGGVIPVLSRLFPTLTQLTVHGVEAMRMARTTTPQRLLPSWRAVPFDDEAEAEEGGAGEATRSEAGSGLPLAPAADFASVRAAYAAFLRHGEFYSLPRLLPHLRALYLDGCTELGQLLDEDDGNGEGEREGEGECFSFGGTTLSLAGAVHDVRTLAHLLVWRPSTSGGSLGIPYQRSDGARHTHQPSEGALQCLRELRLSGCRSLRADPMAGVIVQRCPRLCVLSVADTLLTDAALAHLSAGLQTTLETIDLCGCAAITDVAPLRCCAVLREVRLPGGQLLNARTMSVRCGEGLRGLSALLGRLCPDLRQLQQHCRGSVDAAEVAQIALMGRWVTEVDLSKMVGST
ncbi:hypothetical protein ABB37_09305 [Leptomonas pyrrhocoris]|uniref:Leucine-rich repeat protein n=1 Tax=Leptomonas pyrrhocoris TaxID=157538 RepID=A0A0M9FR21_LEPPY|nr:hypothetical protein ABB37_09305 [Leptomonas pyrrhocoris]KPA74315.1 hypothetical protein ABB37_09305 [Leptomonas pyrrhocoris]|eukprot:XP_015652754.1 hypothetical protein ABB37_09305 [Leptomonas pyrrhocoris]